MIDQIKAFKTELLNKLKSQKAALVNSQPTLQSQKYAAKSVEVAAKAKELDEALAKFKTEKMAALNEEINKKVQAVADKKVALDNAAKAEAEMEAQAEIALQVGEYDKEIAKIEKELA